MRIRSNSPCLKTSISRRMTRVRMLVAAQCGPRESTISTRMGRPVSRGSTSVGSVENRARAREKVGVFDGRLEAIRELRHVLIEVFLANRLNQLRAHAFDRWHYLFHQLQDVIRVTAFYGIGD